MERNLEETRKHFQSDRFACKVTGAVIEEVGDNWAVCSLKLTDDHRNARGQVMGGAIFTLADFCFAVSSNHDSIDTVTTVSQISYLRSVKGDTIYAKSRLIKDGGTTCFYEIMITDSTGNEVASVAVSGMHLKKK